MTERSYPEQRDIIQIISTEMYAASKHFRTQLNSIIDLWSKASSQVPHPLFPCPRFMAAIRNLNTMDLFLEELAESTKDLSFAPRGFALDYFYFGKRLLKLHHHLSICDDQVILLVEIWSANTISGPSIAQALSFLAADIAHKQDYVARELLWFYPKNNWNKCNLLIDTFLLYPVKWNTPGMGWGI